MLTLTNSDLRVELLDPVADRFRLGPRYCSGGFIWQVSDARLGPLVTGPEWPEATPSAWNGQGLPESFRHRTRDGKPLTWNGDRGVAFGAGEIAVNGAGEVELIQPCSWEITPSPNRLVFRTREKVAGFDYELVRTVELNGRTLISISQLTNHGAVPLALEWFAHPFFALTDRLVHAELPAGTTLADNPGFVLTGRTLTQKRRFERVTDGHMDFVQLPDEKILSARFNHPVTDPIVFQTSFVPSECVIWGNKNTFSIEPYQVLALAPGQTNQWNLRYDFGKARAPVREIAAQGDEVSSFISSPTFNSRTPVAR